MKKLIAAITMAMALGACTPELQLQTEPAYSPAWCQAAKAFPRSGTYLYAVAQCHQRGVSGFPQEENVIVYYLTESARWGNTEAGAALASRGLPIPDDDLRREAADRRENERNRQALIQALNPPRPAPRPQTTAPVVRPVVVQPPRPANVNTSTFQRENRSTSTKRNCVNNVCRIETTTCIDGRCTTTVTNQ
ncbi:MAG: hypothetical protein O9342_05165 [Beijerinckiaceae bacterium]|nr:hypothetical protein [Beijerinckiaceae bacterium]